MVGWQLPLLELGSLLEMGPRCNLPPPPLPPPDGLPPPQRLRWGLVPQGVFFGTPRLAGLEQDSSHPLNEGPGGVNKFLPFFLPWRGLHGAPDGGSGCAASPGLTPMCSKD